MLNKIILSIFLGVVIGMPVYGEDTVKNDIVVGEGLKLKDPILENPCMVDPCNKNEECIYEGDGKYRCECENGFTRGEKGVCVNLCSLKDCGKSVCNENIVEGIAICIDSEYKSSNKGVLLCSGLDLSGVCQIRDKAIRATELDFYPYSIKPLTTEITNQWEIYTITTSATYRYSDSEVLNIYQDYQDNVNRFIIQPKNYETFQNIFGSNTPYVELSYKETDGNVRYREVFSLEGTIQNKIFPEKITDKHFFELPINNIVTKNVTTYRYPNINNLESIISEDTPQEFDDGIMLRRENDLDGGLILNKGDEWKSIQYHTYYLNHNKFSSNWPLNSIYESADIIANPDRIYVHSDWEVLACPEVESKLTDCKKVESEVTHIDWEEITRTSSTHGFIPKFLIIQPSNRDKLEEISPENYTILYADPNYSGNSIVYWKPKERYPNPIKQVRSIENKGKINTYLNRKKIYEYMENSALHTFEFKDSNSDDDNYLHTTDSTPWKFDNPNESWDSIFLDDKFEIRNEGLRVCKNINNFFKCITLQSKIETSMLSNDIIDFYIYPDWEVFICKDENKIDCKYFGEGDKLNDLISFLGSDTIKYILVQPKTHQKINQFYGHKEYNEHYGIFPKDKLYPASGYVILYRNREFKDCVPKTCNDDKECASKFCKNNECQPEMATCTSNANCLNGCENNRCVDERKLCTYDNDCLTKKCTDNICEEETYCGQKEIIWGNQDKKVIVGTDTIIKPEEVKGIRGVGNMTYTINGNYLGIDYKDQYVEKHLILDRLNFLTFKDHHPVITLIKGNSYSESFGVGVLKNVNIVGANFLAYRGDSYEHSTDQKYIPLTYDIDTSKELNEEYSQNRDMDNGDMLIITGHGGWNNSGAYQEIANSNDNDFDQYQKNQGLSLGDYETEWMLITSCNSLGDSDDYNTTDIEAIEAYSPLFVNGLHGIGGMYDESDWAPGEGDHTQYVDEAKDFLKDLKNNSIAEAWTETLGMIWHAPSFWLWDGYWARFAGYIAPGPCRGYHLGDKYISSYVHDDHFHGYGNTLRDPDRNFIIQHGYCYYAWSGGRRNSSYDFNEVITHPDDDWEVLTRLGSLNSLIRDNITTFLNDDSYNIIENDERIFYNKNSNEYLSTNSLDKALSDSFIESLKENTDIVYAQVFDKLLTKEGYQLRNIEMSYKSEQHYSGKIVRDENVSITQVVFTYNLSYDGYPFLNQNRVQIGINPQTNEIEFINSEIISIEKTGNVIDSSDMELDLSLLQNDDKTAYYLSYIYHQNEYRVAILSIERESKQVSIVKIY